MYLHILQIISYLTAAIFSINCLPLVTTGWSNIFWESMKERTCIVLLTDLDVFALAGGGEKTVFLP